MRKHSYTVPAFFLFLLILFVLYPVVTVLWKSIIVAGKPDFGNYFTLFINPYFFRNIWSSLIVACSVAVLSTLLGLILSLTVIKTALPLRRIFAVAVMIPMIMPGFVSSLAYIFLFGRDGLISYKLLHITWNIYSWRSVLILQTLSFSTMSALKDYGMCGASLGRQIESFICKRSDCGYDRPCCRILAIFRNL